MFRMTTLALIMAAGYGTRMAKGLGQKRALKAMIPDEQGRLPIDDALTFLRYRSDSLDFAVLSRDEDFFAPLNTHIRDKYGIQDRDIIFQTTKPRSLMIAFAMEYLSNRQFRRRVNGYDNIVLMPADHKLSADQLNLAGLIRKHEATNADVTTVCSPGWRDDTSKKDVISVDDDGRVIYIKRVKDVQAYQPKEGELPTTNVGIWVVKPSLFYAPLKIIPAFLQFSTARGGYPLFTNFYIYQIQNWAGGRDGIK